MTVHDAVPKKAANGQLQLSTKPLPAMAGVFFIWQVETQDR